VSELCWQSFYFQQKLPEWLVEKKLHQLKAERGVTFIEAHKIVSVESKSRSVGGSCTAAAVLGTKSCLTTQPATCSVVTQTELMWPKGQDSSAICELHLTQTDNHASTPPLHFLQARCSSCHPTNSRFKLDYGCVVCASAHGS